MPPFAAECGRQLRGPRHVPVVLLHGVTWSTDINFHGVMGALAQHHPVIAMDQRGHAGGLPATGRFGIEDMADDVVAVLDELGVRRAIFAGFGLGKSVAARYFGANRTRGDEELLKLWPWLRAELARTPRAVSPR